MAQYILLQNVSAVQSAPNSTTPPVASIQPQVGTPPTPPANQGFQVTVTSTSGNCSGTVQIVASNDGVNWGNLGSAIVVSSGASGSTTLGTAQGVYAFYGAYVTAIGGTGANVLCIMNA